VDEPRIEAISANPGHANILFSSSTSGGLSLDDSGCPDVGVVDNIWLIYAGFFTESNGYVPWILAWAAVAFIVAITATLLVRRSRHSKPLCTVDRVGLAALSLTYWSVVLGWIAWLDGGDYDTNPWYTTTFSALAWLTLGTGLIAFAVASIAAYLERRSGSTRGLRHASWLWLVIILAAGW